MTTRESIVKKNHLKHLEFELRNAVHEITSFSSIN